MIFILRQYPTGMGLGLAWDNKQPENKASSARLDVLIQSKEMPSELSDSRALALSLHGLTTSAEGGTVAEISISKRRPIGGNSESEMMTERVLLSLPTTIQLPFNSHFQKDEAPSGHRRRSSASSASSSSTVKFKGSQSRTLSLYLVRYGVVLMWFHYVYLQLFPFGV